ncbi:MAG TPA: hypothetical protein VHO94_03770 [Oscillospiraceae bacterium]|nr:hypothetical protein [Oscillospiraceae bacterium]
MNRFVKILAIFLICLIASLSLYGCKSKSSAGLSHQIIDFINYDNKIYELKISDSFDKSLVGEKISGSPSKTENSLDFNYYKIVNVDTDKAIALGFTVYDFGFSKYEYLCEESFTLNNKSYKISCNNWSINLKDETYLGKSLGKVDNLEVFKNAKDNSEKSLIVHPAGLLKTDERSQYLLATEIANDTNTFKK